MAGTRPAMTKKGLRAPLLNRQRIDRRSDSARDRYCRRDEQKFVHGVGGAIVGQVLDLENLAHGHAHDRDRDPVPRLVDARFRFVRPHLAAPGVACERRQLGALHPLQGFERKTGRITTRITVPAAELLAALHLAGANDDVIAALQLYLLLACRAIEVIARDAVTIVE